MTFEDVVVERASDGRPVVLQAPADVLISVGLIGLLDASDWATFDRETNVFTIHAVGGPVRYQVARFRDDLAVEAHRMA